MNNMNTTKLDVTFKNNNIFIKDFNNPWNNRDLWCSFLDITLIKSICKDPKVILEFGSYDGADGIKYKYHFPNAEVYSIEASYESYKKIKPLEKYGLHVFNYAISNENKKKLFYPTYDEENNNIAPCGSIDKKYISTNKGNGVPPLKILKGVETDCITIKTFCTLQNIPYIDLIHIDVEGHCIEVLEGFGDIRPKLIYIEVRNDTHDLSNEVYTILTNLKYTLIQYKGSDQVWVDNT
jgi:FkbM family methyltransferase